MNDIVLDTNILSDFLASYFLFKVNLDGNFESYKTISLSLANRLNVILDNYRNYGTLSEGVILASTFAFIEIARKFEQIADNRFNIIQLKAFIDTHPEWFIIAPLNNELFPYLNNLPSNVTLQSGHTVPLEWADTIHIATAQNRSNDCKIVITDNRLLAIQGIQDRLFT